MSLSYYIPSPIIPQDEQGRLSYIRDELNKLSKWGYEVSDCLDDITGGTSTFDKIIIANDTAGRSDWEMDSSVALDGSTWHTNVSVADSNNQLFSWALRDAANELRDFNMIAAGSDTRLDIPNALHIDQQDTPAHGTFAFRWNENGSGFPWMRMYPTNGYPSGNIDDAFITLEVADSSSNLMEYRFNQYQFQIPDTAGLKFLDSGEDMKIIPGAVGITNGLVFSSPSAAAATEIGYKFDTGNSRNVTIGYGQVFLGADATTPTMAVKKSQFDEVKERPYAHLTVTTAQNHGGATGTKQWVNWDGTQLNVDTGFTHSTSTNPSRIQVDADGTYELIWVVGIEQGGSNRTTYSTQYRVNGGSDVIRGRQRNYSRGSNYGDVSVGQVTIIPNLTNGDYIEVGTTVDNTDAVYTSNSVPSECELIIRKIS